MPPKCEAGHLDVYAGTFCFMLYIHAFTVIFLFGLSVRSSYSFIPTEQHSLSLMGLSFLSKLFVRHFRCNTADSASLISRHLHY
jgi:hypothetical protein